MRSSWARRGRATAPPARRPANGSTTTMVIWPVLVHHPRLPAPARRVSVLAARAADAPLEALGVSLRTRGGTVAAPVAAIVATRRGVGEAWPVATSADPARRRHSACMRWRHHADGAEDAVRRRRPRTRGRQQVAGGGPCGAVGRTSCGRPGGASSARAAWSVDADSMSASAITPERRRGAAGARRAALAELGARPIGRRRAWAAAGYAATPTRIPSRGGAGGAGALPPGEWFGGDAGNGACAIRTPLRRARSRSSRLGRAPTASSSPAAAASSARCSRAASSSAAGRRAHGERRAGGGQCRPSCSLTRPNLIGAPLPRPGGALVHRTRRRVGRRACRSLFADTDGGSRLGLPPRRDHVGAGREAL